jgi:hypothetical protein
VRCTDSIIDQQPRGSLKWHGIYKQSIVRFALSAAREKRKRDARHACLPAKISRRNGIARVQCQCFPFFPAPPPLPSPPLPEGELQVVTTVRGTSVQIENGIPRYHSLVEACTRARLRQ